MMTHHARHNRLWVIPALIILFSISAFGQSASIEAPVNEKEIADLKGSETVSANKILPVDLKTSLLTQAKPAETPSRGSDIESELEAVKAENAIVREQVRLLMEQQRKMIEQVGRLQRRLDVDPNADTQTTAALSPDAARPGDPADPGVDSVKSVKKDPKEDRYQDGIVIWKNPDEAKVPFMLRLNAVTQFRYLNTLDSDNSFTDHLGVVRDINNRNDLTVNRTMFLFNGYFYDKKLQYSLMVWTAAGAASIIVAGSIGWQFNKHLTITGGYLGIPGSRSLTNTFPYFASTDRTMADNFFRPGFTQGVMASGEITKNLYYMAFLGNSLNTLSISANKIDNNLMGSGSVWWEPLGGYSRPGRTVNMYDDYFAEDKLRVRLGTSFTISREDRFSNLDTSSPENTGIYNSDGVNAFQTGAFAPGVTVLNATYKMWAMDWGLKYKGLAINGQYYFRWLNDFNADGPLPLDSTFDHGWEMSVGHFVVPKKVMVYGRGSGVWGQFKNPYEYGAGVKWYFLPTERLWMNAELFNVKGAAYSGAFSPYTSGMNGWVPMIQTVLSF